MNRKVITSCLVLSICLAAAAPVYRNLSFNREILEPVTSQQSGTQPSRESQLSDTEILKAESLETHKEINPANTGAAVTSNTAALNPADVKASNTQSKPASTSNKKAAGAGAVKTSGAARKVSSKAAPAKSTAKVSTAAKSKAKTTAKSSRGTSAAVTSKAGAVINTARNYMGVPYVWGGTTPSGFDCSGFTQYVLKKNGVSIPRTTAEQYAAGVSVSKSNLRTGDLVFFTTYKAGPSHVGFYIGDGNFIHASSSKGVTISNLSSTYYSDRYIGAKRVF